jgi:hypothetical protein
MIKGIEQRLALASVLDARNVSRNIVHDIPEVESARKAFVSAQQLADDAQEAYDVVFAHYATKQTEAAIAQGYPGVLLLGEEDFGKEFAEIARCAISQLPIFVGDLVYISGSDDISTYILAAAVPVAPEYKATPVIVGSDGRAVESAEAA